MSSTPRSSNVASPEGEGNGEQLLRRREAARYLATSLRWLEGRSDIPVVNLAGTASRRPMLRYRKRDLDRFIARHSRPNDEERR